MAVPAREVAMPRALPARMGAIKRLGQALAERDFALLWLALLGMGVSVQSAPA